MRISFLSVALFSGVMAFAQTEPRTLFNSSQPKSWGAFIGSGIQGGQMYGENTWFYNVRAGAVINDAWSLGLVYGQTMNEIRPPVITNGLTVGSQEFDFYYYGAFAEYRIKPNNLLHLSFPLNLGVFESDYDYDGIPNFDWESDANDYQFFVEPGVNLELNVHRFVKFYAGASYRFQVASIYSDGIPQAPENHLMFNVGLKVGIFNFKNL
jgi:hypothetical protein